jgi:hypothetical protein
MRVELLVLVTFSGLLVEKASAQGPVKLRGNGGSPAGCIGWLSMPSVQQELKLQPEQVDKARGIARDLHDRYEEARKSFEGLPRQETSQKLVALADAQYEEGMKALGAFLKMEQVDRFDQIWFQKRGARAMLEPRVVEALKLTDGQRKQINRVVVQSLNQQNVLVRDNRNDPIAQETKVLANVKEFKLRAVELLDADQKKIWEQISGPPFEKAIGDVVTP